MGLNDLPMIIHEEIKSCAREVFKELYSPTQLLSGLPEDSILPEELAGAFRVELSKIYRMAQTGMPHSHLGREYRFFKPLLIEWVLTGQEFPCGKCTGNKEPADVKQPKEDKSAKQSVVSINDKTKEKLARTWR